MRCTLCGQPIRPGEAIFLADVGPGYVHLRCREVIDLRPPAQSPDIPQPDYRRTLLIFVLVYHARMDSASCLCGWAELGRSHAAHVADVYEQAILNRSVEGRS